jgi:ABC-type polysaccharide/polyol phosphate export permease
MTIASRLPGALFFRLLIHNHSLVYQLVRRDFEQRYVGSVAGWVWGLIHPLVLLGVYTFVFAHAFQMKLPPHEVTESYPLFLFAGMLPWLLFSETLQRSASSLVDYANLIKKSVFPAEVVPLSIFLSTLISHFLALLLLLAGVTIWLHPVGLAVLMLPLYLVLLGMFSLGLSWIAAGLHVYLRDTAQVLTVVLTAWFWLTPIFLFEDLFTDRFDGRLAVLLRINPLVYVVRGYRDMVLANEFPAWQDVLALAGFSIVTLVLGGLFFRHTKRGFADVL